MGRIASTIPRKAAGSPPTRGDWLRVDVTNPQTWNRYAYVTNSPLSFIDPTGLNRAFPGQCSDGNGICPDEGGGADPTSIDGGNYVGSWGSPIFGSYWNDGWHTYISGFFGGQGQNGDGGPCYYVLANPCGAANNGTPQTPQQPRPHGCGLAIAQGALSVGLDVVGAIPGFGNAVSATAAGARAVNGIVAYGGAAYGIGTGLGDESPVGAASAGAGLGPKEREAE
jgi:hypothetical protein